MIKYNIKNHDSFSSSKKRGNSKIRSDRISSRHDSSKLIYMREIKALEVLVKKLKRELEGVLSSSPAEGQDEAPAINFNSNAYVSKEIELGVKIKNSELKLENAKKRFHFLYNDK